MQKVYVAGYLFNAMAVDSFTQFPRCVVSLIIILLYVIFGLLHPLPIGGKVSNLAPGLIFIYFYLIDYILCLSFFLCRLGDLPFPIYWPRTPCKSGQKLFVEEDFGVLVLRFFCHNLNLRSTGSLHSHRFLPLLNPLENLRFLPSSCCWTTIWWPWQRKTSYEELSFGLGTVLLFLHFGPCLGWMRVTVAYFTCVGSKLIKLTWWPGD